ncbi:hypothetical protein, partial [Mesorhizobium sp.]|uniref:hypothetical protein n=1 Tax=Mesorhizobium sp. TaxID=1871066 RepID=UPI0025FC7EAC
MAEPSWRQPELAHSGIFRHKYFNLSMGAVSPAPLTLPQFLSSFEFVSGVGCALLGGCSDGRWRGAFGIAQRERPS